MYLHLCCLKLGTLGSGLAVFLIYHIYASTRISHDCHWSVVNDNVEHWLRMFLTGTVHIKCITIFVRVFGAGVFINKVLNVVPWLLRFKLVFPFGFLWSTHSFIVVLLSTASTTFSIGRTRRFSARVWVPFATVPAFATFAGYGIPVGCFRAIRISVNMPPILILFRSSSRVFPRQFVDVLFLFDGFCLGFWHFHGFTGVQ